MSIKTEKHFKCNHCNSHTEEPGEDIRKCKLKEGVQLH